MFFWSSTTIGRESKMKVINDAVINITLSFIIAVTTLSSLSVGTPYLDGRSQGN